MRPDRRNTKDRTQALPSAGPLSNEIERRLHGRIRIRKGGRAGWRDRKRTGRSTKTGPSLLHLLPCLLACRHRQELDHEHNDGEQENNDCEWHESRFFEFFFPLFLGFRRSGFDVGRFGDGRRSSAAASTHGLSLLQLHRCLRKRLGAAARKRGGLLSYRSTTTGRCGCLGERNRFRAYGSATTRSRGRSTGLLGERNRLGAGSCRGSGCRSGRSGCRRATRRGSRRRFRSGRRRRRGRRLGRTRCRRRSRSSGSRRRRGSSLNRLRRTRLIACGDRGGSAFGRDRNRRSLRRHGTGVLGTRAQGDPHGFLLQRHGRSLRRRLRRLGRLWLGVAHIRNF